MGKRERRRDVVKERFWRRAMAEHQRSGLSIREFCARRSLPEPSFYAWRRELARQDKAARKALPSAGSAQPLQRFVSLQLAPRPAPAMIEIVTRSGHTLHVPSGVDRQTLVDVWAVLEGDPC